MKYIYSCQHIYKFKSWLTFVRASFRTRTDVWLPLDFIRTLELINNKIHQFYDSKYKTGFCRMILARKSLMYNSKESYYHLRGQTKFSHINKTEKRQLYSFENTLKYYLWSVVYVDSKEIYTHCTFLPKNPLGIVPITFWLIRFDHRILYLMNNRKIVQRLSTE